MDIDGDGGRPEFGLRDQRRGTEIDKGNRRKFALPAKEKSLPTKSAVALPTNPLPSVKVVNNSARTAFYSRNGGKQISAGAGAPARKRTQEGRRTLQQTVGPDCQELFLTPFLKYKSDCMDEWLHNLPVWWMAFVVFAIAYLAAGGIFVIIMALAKGRAGARLQKRVPEPAATLGTIFGLLVAFSAVQAWNDMDRAKVAVDREASAIRMVVLLATSFSGRA